MFGWFKPKRETKQEWQNPFLAIELEPNGRVTTYAHLGSPENEDEMKGFAQGMALLAYMLNDGQFMALLQGAIAIAGEREGLPAMAKIALDGINQLIAAKAKTEGANDLCVPPDKAFNPIPNGVPLND
jgi:hypothetical protein